MSNSLLSFRVFSSFCSSSSTDLRRLYRRKMIVAAGIIPASSPYHTFPGFVPRIISFASIEYVAHVFDLSSRFFRFSEPFHRFSRIPYIFIADTPMRVVANVSRDWIYAKSCVFDFQKYLRRLAQDRREKRCKSFFLRFPLSTLEKLWIGLNFDIRMSPNIKIYHSS